MPADEAAGLRAAARDHNTRAWDRLAEAGAALARPAVDAAFTDPRGWLGGGAAGRPKRGPITTSAETARTAPIIA